MEIKDLIGDPTTVMSGIGLEDVLVRHAIPYVMGVIDVSEKEAKNGAQPYILYASSSKNGKFKDDKDKQIKFDAVQYSTLDDLYIQMVAAEEGSFNGAFSYLLNIQKICNRCVSDCAIMLRKHQISHVQYTYMEKHLNMVSYDSYQVLEEQKKILIHESHNIPNFLTKTEGMSKNCQLFRMAQSLRLLIEVGAVARGF